MGCAGILRAGTTLVGPRDGVALVGPRGLTATVTVTFTAPARHGDTTQFRVTVQSASARKGAKGKPITRTLVSITPPVMVTVPRGMLLFVFDAATDTYRAQNKAVVTHAGTYTVGRAARGSLTYLFSPQAAASAFALGADRAQVHGGRQVRLYAATRAGARVTLRAFGVTRSGTADRAGLVAFVFTAPRVRTAQTFAALGRVTILAGRGAKSITQSGQETVRVVP